MLTERVWKYRLVARFFRQPLPVAKTTPKLVSIIQPVLSGDPTMSACLECSLRLQSASQLEFIWVLDEDDREGQRICQELCTRYPERDMQLVIVPPPPAGYSPKTFKLIEGRKRASGEVICVLDDDTMLPENGLDMVLPFLEQSDVGVAFGLPYYVNFSNAWSSMVSCFVNSNSLLTYIPYTFAIEPVTVIGMFYVLRSEVLDRVGGFDVIKYAFVDDFAVAQLCRTHGYRLVQTPLCHGVSTKVRDGRHYVNLIQRWFVFPRESILRHIPWYKQFLFYAYLTIPMLFPFFLLLSLVIRPSRAKLYYTLLYFGCNLAIIHHLNEKYLRQATPRHKAWLIPVMLVLIPIQMVVALFSPQRVDWRGNIVQVKRGGSFKYIQRRK
jgi:ceramide glucosyltransferase